MAVSGVIGYNFQKLSELREVKKDRHSLGTIGGKIRGGQGTSLRLRRQTKNQGDNPRTFFGNEQCGSVGREKSKLGVWTPGRPDPRERSVLFMDGDSLKKIRAVLFCLQ